MTERKKKPESQYSRKKAAQTELGDLVWRGITQSETGKAEVSIDWDGNVVIRSKNGSSSQTLRSKLRWDLEAKEGNGSAAQ